MVASKKFKRAQGMEAMWIFWQIEYGISFESFDIQLFYFLSTFATQEESPERQLLVLDEGSLLETEIVKFRDSQYLNEDGKNIFMIWRWLIMVMLMLKNGLIFNWTWNKDACLNWQ